jgi:peptidoglycan/LPS O-acetylase OafA/YrhL
VRASLERSRPQSARGYVVRRAIRILPVYWVAILIVWASRNGRLPGDWRDLLEHLTFTQVFDDKRIFYTIGPAWSLAIEVMFYAFLLLVGQLMVRLCRRVPRRAGALAWVLLCLLLVAVGMLWKVAHVAGGTSYDAWSVWFGPLAKIDIFAVGMLLAVVAAVLPRPLRVPAVAPAVARVLGVAVVAWSWWWRGPFGQAKDEYAHTVVAVGFALVLLGSVLASEGSLWERALATRPMLLLGTISYSLYLWHEPVLLQLAGHHWVLTERWTAFLPGTALLLVLSIAAGWISYLAIEYPVMQVRRHMDRSGRLTTPYVDAPDRVLSS